MPLKFKCEFCQTDIEVEVFKKGDKLGCRACGNLITVPQDAEGNAILLKKNNLYHCSLCNHANAESAIICENCESDIEEIRSFCSTCESINNLEAKYCRKCGAALYHVETKIIKYCEKCGVEYGNGDIFCERDGSKLVTKEVEGDSVDLQQASPAKDGSKLVHEKIDPEIISNPEKGFFAKLLSRCQIIV